MHEIALRNQEKSQLNLINRATGVQGLRLVDMLSLSSSLNKIKIYSPNNY